MTPAAIGPCATLDRERLVNHMGCAIAGASSSAAYERAARVEVRPDFRYGGFTIPRGIDSLPADEDVRAAGVRQRKWRQTERHSRRVRRMRIVVPAAAGVLALFLVGATLTPSLLSAIGLEGLELSKDGLVMNGPKLSGHLDGDRRYSVTAERAVQSLTDPSKLTLENIVADLDLGKDGWVKISGARARYDTSTEILRLTDGISVTSSEGHRARLSSAALFLKEGRFESAEPITISSPKGEISAGRLNVERDGDVIRMKGGVNVMINPARGGDRS